MSRGIGWNSTALSTWSVAPVSIVVVALKNPVKGAGRFWNVFAAVVTIVPVMFMGAVTTMLLLGKSGSSGVKRRFTILAVTVNPGTFWLFTILSVTVNVVGLPATAR